METIIIIAIGAFCMGWLIGSLMCLEMRDPTGWTKQARRMRKMQRDLDEVRLQRELTLAKLVLQQLK